MIVSLLSVLVLAGVAWFIFNLISKRKEKKKKELITSLVRNSNKILQYLSKSEEKQEKKIKIMEDVLLGIEQFKNAVERLRGLEMIEEDEETLKLTEFGDQYCQVFIISKRSDPNSIKGLRDGIT